jgi:uncharacterized protein
MAGTFAISKSNDGQFHFNLKAADNEVILSSETYTSKGGTENGIESMKQNALLDER